MAKKKPVSPDLVRIEYEDLDVLRRFPKNPKLHDAETLDDSLKRFGYVDPVLVDEGTGYMVKGHGRLERLEVMKKAGLEPPDRILVKDGKWLVPVVRGVKFKNRREAEGYLVADNQTTILGGWDAKELGRLMASWEPEELEGTGFDANDLVRFVSLAKESGGPSAFPQVGEDIPVEFCCPKCKYKWSGNPDPLGHLGGKAA